MDNTEQQEMYVRSIIKKEFEVFFGDDNDEMASKISERVYKTITYKYDLHLRQVQK